MINNNDLDDENSNTFRKFVVLIICCVQRVLRYTQ